MSAGQIIDFHTHWNGSAQPADPEALKIISLPLEQIDQPLPADCAITLELHPWQGGAFTEEFARAAAMSKVIGIGEAGLDRLRGALPLAEQMEIFSRTIQLAEKLHKPLTVHCVRCFSELLELKKRLKWQVATIIHYFTGKAGIAEQLLRHENFILSLPPCCSEEVLELWRSNRQYDRSFVLETDDPAGGIARHYQYVAQKLNISNEELVTVMRNQFGRIYHVGKQC